jgi:phosphoenolpyruvate-protein phosphotransferase
MGQTIKGLPASTGVAIGPVWIYRPVHVEVERRKVASPEAERQRLEAALTQAGEQLQVLYQRTLENIGEEEAAIFEAHQLVLQDPELLAQVQTLIDSQHLNAEAAFNDVVEQYAQSLLALEDEYFRARAQDVRDVGRRILYSLKGIRPEDIALPTRPVVIVAEDLTPSDTVQFDKSVILGFCTVRGGPTSHTAIIARSIGVPAVVSAPVPIEALKNGDTVVLDGTAGTLLLDPSETELAQAVGRQSGDQAEWEIQLAAAHQPAITQDGVRVEVVANIGGVGDAQTAILNGAEGVGLLRTEFLYLDRDSMPDEEEQVNLYQSIFEVLKPWPVVVRTLDIGGDKSVSYLGIQAEPNPFLGWRAIRMMSERPDVLVSQFRALLRAGTEADLRIMLPMVSSVNEVRQAKALLAQAIESLEADGTPFQKKFQFGIMVEVPSAALLAEHLADEVDFFSIGTNDLTQYTLAVDRTNERVAPLASPLHPAVVQLIALTIRAAHKKGRWVGLCGELAGDPLAAPLLLGLGLDEFSMAAKSIPVVKQLLRRLSRSECEKIAEQVLSLPTTQEVEALLRSAVQA